MGLDSAVLVNGVVDEDTCRLTDPRKDRMVIRIVGKLEEEAISMATPYR